MGRRFTAPLALLGGFLLGMWSLAKHVWDAPANLKLETFVYSFTGYWMPSKKFSTNNGGGAASLAILAGYGIHKGLGQWAGINRELGRARVPIARL